MSETLKTCPKCGRTNFTPAGLKSHKCRPAGPGEPGGPPMVPALVAKLPVAGITGTWDGARKWRDAAVRMEQGKLFCQVMLGFELLALRATLGVEHGKKTDSSQIGKSSDNWVDLIEQELGLSRTSAYRMMEMAEAAKVRLKKLPELRDFDPTTQAVAALPEKQQSALTTAVKKLTDGTTQVDFMRDLGIAKLPQGGGATGRAKGDTRRPEPLTLTAQAELLRAVAEDDWRHLEDLLLRGYRAKFTLLNDTQVTAQVAALEAALSARQAWLKTPPERRDPHATDAEFPL